jgi:hypothetical protein
MVIPWSPVEIEKKTAAFVAFLLFQIDGAMVDGDYIFRFREGGTNAPCSSQKLLFQEQNHALQRLNKVQFTAESGQPKQRGWQ